MKLITGLIAVLSLSAFAERGCSARQIQCDVKVDGSKLGQLCFDEHYTSAELTVFGEAPNESQESSDTVKKVKAEITYDHVNKNTGVRLLKDADGEDENNFESIQAKVMLDQYSNLFVDGLIFDEDENTPIFRGYKGPCAIVR